MIFANLEVRLFLLFLGYPLLHLRGYRLGTHTSTRGDPSARKVWGLVISRMFPLAQFAGEQPVGFRSRGVGDCEKPLPHSWIGYHAAMAGSGRLRKPFRADGRYSLS